MQDKDQLFLDTTLVDVKKDQEPKTDAMPDEGGHRYFF